jgi:hypothetical protein
MNSAMKYMFVLLDKIDSRGLCGIIGKFLRSTFPWKTGDGTGQSAKPENSASLAFAHLRGRILRRMTALSKNTCG